MLIVKRFVDAAVAAIEQQRWLDAPGYKFEHGIALAFAALGSRGRTVQDLLHGTPLGHPLHPALTDVPLGAWTTAAALDVVDVISPRPQGWQQAAQLAVGVGVFGATGAALTGMTDWQHTHDEARRSGLVHGLLNSAALALNVLSWRDRRHGRNARARRASLLGYGFVLAGGHLGGNLVFRHRIGVDHSQKAPAGPSSFVAVLAEADLAENTPRQVWCEGMPVVLIRHEDRIDAVGARCPHLGAPMSDGWLYRGDLVCPWHGSRFDPRTGCTTTGPATAPLTHYQTRVDEGQIEVRRVPPAPSPQRRRASETGQSR